MSRSLWWQSLLVLVVLGLAGTGCGGQPNQIQVRAYSVQGTDGRQLFLVFPWERDGICSGQFSADVRETPTVVTVSKIKNSYDGGGCAGLGTDGVSADLLVELRAPLGSRQVQTVAGRTLERVPAP